MQGILECKQCGGQLEIDSTEHQKVVICKFCGSANTLSFVDRFGLYNRANYLRRNNEFDRAIGVYEDILKENEKDAEAYYGIALCKYGIEYVDDPYGKGKIPTCHRTRFTPMSQDVDFRKALEYADEETGTIYADEAEKIDRIQKEILALSAKEEKYDIFICYKEGDGVGGRTQASVYAQEIYQSLEQKGYRVFFARKTLEKKLGKDYEPIIFAALFSAKVMLVVGTEPAQFESVWVKNEWSRYRERLAAGEDCTLIPLYQDMSPYELPQEFSNLQALDMGKIGFQQDLMDGIDRLLPKAGSAERQRVSAGPVTIENVNVENLKKRAKLFLEQEDFNSALQYYEKVLDTDAEDAEAYVGKMLVDRRMTDEEVLGEAENSFSEDRNFILALRFADEELKSRLGEYEMRVNERIRAKEEERRRRAEEEEERRKAEEEERRRRAEEEEENERRKKEEKRSVRMKVIIRILKFASIVAVISVGFITWDLQKALFYRYVSRDYEKAAEAADDAGDILHQRWVDQIITLPEEYYKEKEEFDAIVAWESGECIYNGRLEYKVTGDGKVKTFIPVENIRDYYSPSDTLKSIAEKLQKAENVRNVYVRKISLMEGKDGIFTPGLGRSSLVFNYDDQLGNEEPLAVILYNDGTLQILNDGGANCNEFSGWSNIKDLKCRAQYIYGVDWNGNVMQANIYPEYGVININNYFENFTENTQNINWDSITDDWFKADPLEAVIEMYYANEELIEQKMWWKKSSDGMIEAAEEIYFLPGVNDYVLKIWKFGEWGWVVFVDGRVECYLDEELRANEEN